MHNVLLINLDIFKTDMDLPFGALSRNNRIPQIKNLMYVIGQLVTKIFR